MIIFNNKKDQMAFDFMGNAYLVIPRSVLERALSPEEQERQAGMLHLALLAKCYHSDETVLLSSGKVPCRRGEFVGSRVKVCGYDLLSPLREKETSALIENITIMFVLTKEEIPYTNEFTLESLQKWILTIPSNQRVLKSNLIIITN